MERTIKGKKRDFRAFSGRAAVSFLVVFIFTLMSPMWEMKIQWE